MTLSRMESKLRTTTRTVRKVPPPLGSGSPGGPTQRAGSDPHGFLFPWGISVVVTLYDITHTYTKERTYTQGFDDLRATGSMRAAFEAEQLSSRPPAPRPTRTTRSRARCHVAKPLLLLGRTTKYKWVGVVMVVIAVAIAVVALMPLLLPLPFARYRFLAACVLPLSAAALFVMLLLCVFVFLSHPVPKHRRSSLLMIELGGNAGTRAPTAHFGGCVYF